MDDFQDTVCPSPWYGYGNLTATCKEADYVLSGLSICHNLEYVFSERLMMFVKKSLLLLIEEEAAAFPFSSLPIGVDQYHVSFPAGIDRCNVLV